MTSEPFWLDVEAIARINRDVVAETGGPHGIRDLGLLAGAADRPLSLWHHDKERNLVALAARLLIGIAANHPSAQGDKRTAFASAILFLQANGCSVNDPESSDTEGLARLVEDAVVSRDEAALREGLRVYVSGPTRFSDEMPSP